MALLLPREIDDEIPEDESAGISEDMLDEIKNDKGGGGDAKKEGGRAGADEEEQTEEEDEGVDFDKYDDKDLL